MSNKTIDLNKYDNKLQAVVFSDFKEVSPTDNVAADPSSWFVVGYKSGGTSTANSERRYSLSDLKSALNIGNNNNVSITCTYIRLSENEFDNYRNNFNNIQSGWNNNFPTPNANKPYLVCRLTVGTTSIYLVSKDGKDGTDGISGDTLTLQEVQNWVNSQNFLKTETDPKVPNWAKQSTKPSYTWNEISGKPNLFDGDYNNLSNKPTIPEAANNATLTIKKNGSAIGTFTANSSVDKTVDIIITPDGLGDVLATSTSASNKQIKNLADPTDNQDAVTLSYLNAQLESLENAIEALQNVINPTAAVPTVTTGTCSQTANGTLSFSGYLASTGNATITDMGFVYGTSANPTTSDTKVTVTPRTTVGNFNTTKSGIANGTYHIRAYATNSVGTSYGSDVTVTVETLTGITDVKYSINGGQSWYTASATSPNTTSDTDDGTMYYVKTTTPYLQDGRIKIKIKSDTLPSSISFKAYNPIDQKYSSSTDEYKTTPFVTGQDDTYYGIYLVSSTADSDGYYEYQLVYWDGDIFLTQALDHKIIINL